MLAEAERLDRLVADLLVLARLEAADFPLEVRDVDLTQLVRGGGRGVGGAVAAAGWCCARSCRRAGPCSRTDPGRVRQVVDGLLENALRVVPPGAPVVARPLYAGRSTAASIEVRDGGPGFTDDDLAVAFERGALLRSATGRPQGRQRAGAGARRPAGRAGSAGSIEAGHAPEGGARFTVRLPADASSLPINLS